MVAAEKRAVPYSLLLRPNCAIVDLTLWPVDGMKGAAEAADCHNGEHQNFVFYTSRWLPKSDR